MNIAGTRTHIAAVLSVAVARQNTDQWLPVACIALAVCLTACEPPCEDYWRGVCEECGQESGACRSAREVADATLDEEPACGNTRAAWERLGETAHARWCGIHDDRPADEAELTQHSFICSGVRVRFVHDAIEISGEPFRTYDRHRGRFGVHMTPSQTQYCEYHLAPHEHSGGEIALWIDCTVALGALGERPTWCLRAHE